MMFLVRLRLFVAGRNRLKYTGSIAAPAAAKTGTLIVQVHHN